MDQISENTYKGIEGICPKGMKLALLKYETEDLITLDFRSKEYLDAKIIVSSSASAIMLSPDEELGPNGLKNKMCHIKSIYENDTRDIDIELGYSINVSNYFTICTCSSLAFVSFKISIC